VVYANEAVPCTVKLPAIVPPVKGRYKGAIEAVAAYDADSEFCAYEADVAYDADSEFCAYEADVAYDADSEFCAYEADVANEALFAFNTYEADCANFTYEADTELPAKYEADKANEAVTNKLGISDPVPLYNAFELDICTKFWYDADIC
jgi:hypothetical protein